MTVEMQFLADVELICEDCKGTRYKPGVLDVRFKGKNIHEVLNLTVREALQFFLRACRRSPTSCACWKKLAWVISGWGSRRQR